jgi:exonuclease III
MVFSACNELSCITINVRGLNDISKRKSLFYWLQDKKVDIILLQETYVTKDTLSMFDRDWNGIAIHDVSDSSHSRGVCILLKEGVYVDVKSIYILNNGRAVLANIEIKDQLLTIVSIYCPNDTKQRKEFLSHMQCWIAEKADYEDFLIVGGDFNCCATSIDKSTILSENTTYFSDFKSFINATDTWRHHNPEIVQYTYCGHGFPQYGSRIDYILASNILSNSIKHSAIIHAPVPDHNAVVTVFHLDKENRGEGYWKLNVSVLDEEAYQASIRHLISDTVEEYEGSDKLMVW